jgi:hypothetical protein
MPLRFINQEIPAAANAVTALLTAQQNPSETVDQQTAHELRQQFSLAREEYNRQYDALRGSYEAIAQRRADLEAAHAAGETSRLPELEARLEESLLIREQQASSVRNAANEMNGCHVALVDGLGTAAAFSHLAPFTPIALLPVRLETRYVAKDALHYELRVRIFPDAIHLDSHQTLMSLVENQDGRAYWEKRLADGPEAETTRMAWHALCERHGESRVLWIAAALDPYGRGGRYQPGDGGPGAPPIPMLPVAPSGWIDPARMRALPDRWAIVGFRDQHRILLHWTKPVPPWLQVTPELGEPGSELEGGQDAKSLSAGIEWLTDFNVAEEVGMAARIPVSRTVARAMDRLLVFGISASHTATDATAELEELLAVHAATGLDFVPPGTATNNLESERTEFRSRRHDHAESHERLLTNNPNNPADGHGARLASRLGVDAAVFRHASHSRERLDAYIEALHNALWPATWGNVLTRQVEVNVTPATLDFVRMHFARHVRGLGLLPTLRLGPQPYGVLAVISLELWNSGSSGERSAAMRQTLAGPIPDPWEPPPEPPDVRRTLVNLLRSVRNYCRRAYGSIAYMPNNRNGQSEMMKALSMEPTSHVVRAQTITPVPGQVDQVTAAMTNWWQQALIALNTGPIDFSSAYGGARLGSRRSAQTINGFDTDRPLVSAQPDKSLPLAANYIAALAGLPNSQTVRDHGIAGAGEKSLLYMLLRSAYLELTDTGANTAAFAASLGVLQNLPVTTLELLTTEVVDVCTYRADAWVSSIANERLPSAGKVSVGGYGWSEGLEPPGEPVSANGTVQQDPDSAGFIHMPSAAQAKTAAVLYGGHLAHADQGSGETLSLNLSSDRVRAARWLIEGQRQGQSLSALLGYRFERQLIENNLAQHIPAVRAALPLPVGNTPANGTEVARGNVVDGLALHKHWDEGTLTTVLTPSVAAAIQAHVASLDDALDALSDLLVAEGVHQAINGNPTRAAAAFDALAEGEMLQDDPDVIATPATGQQVSHRVMVVLPGGARPTWPGDENRARAVAEPRLNRWAAMLLGAPSAIHWRAELYVRGVDGGVIRAIRRYTLADFDLCPLDLVYLAGEHAGEAPLTELIRLRLWQLGRDSQGGSLEDLRLHLERFDGLADNALSLEEALGLAWALKRLLAESRALEAGDLQAEHGGPASGPIEGPSLVELQGRASTARQIVDAVHDAYAANASLANWWRASVLTGPVDPLLPDGPPALLAALKRRAAEADAVTETDAGRAALARLAALLGKEFRVSPQVRAPNGTALQAAFSDSGSLLENDGTRPLRWLHDYARVRAGCEALDLLLMLARAFTRIMPVVVGQFPALPGQIWIGDRVGPHGVTPRLSIVAHTPFAVGATGDLAGLLVDRWSEVVPSPRSTTGVAFNYDEPKAQAPQAVLLAVPPDPARPWDFQLLEATLLETFELAKLRGMVAEELSDSELPAGGLEFYRPALHLSGNQRPDLETASVGA